MASSCSQGLKELIPVDAPLERMVGKVLDLVILGEMTGLLLFCSTGAAPVAGTVAAGF